MPDNNTRDEAVERIARVAYERERSNGVAPAGDLPWEQQGESRRAEWRAEAAVYVDALGDMLDARPAKVIKWGPFTKVLTAEELAAAPRGTIVRAADDTIACRFDDQLGVVFGDDRPFPWSVLRAPAMVLWMPEGGDRA